ncbi:adenylate/guanylate cyclase domain-containing protein [Marinospirillum alkaliphilum]|uniref:Adenylate cyclase n=1 Tax=Marinospirillum alkaliphilum DSM 21637 TaxID=1122209 RepID=A0A1K1TJW4_9GAMM|nr:adenylate/guanylate cyclase domain-containing protein [Marinospirillum alkaliphilum]SFX00700.1 adenylate cyclase [Marinospirillum alkaliphilum DSM 21637]
MSAIKNLPHRTRSFTFNQVMLFATLTILVGSLIILFNYSQSHRSALQLSEQLTEQITENVAARLSQHFSQSASHLRTLLALESDSSRLEKTPQLERLMKERLSNRYISSIYLADSEGRYFQARQHPEPSLRHLAPVQGQRVEIIEYLDEDLNTRIIESRLAEHDPLLQDWYLQAVDRRNPFMSSVYRFDQTEQRGITLSVPLFDDSGLRIKVAGMDITLDALQRYMQRQAEILGGELVLYDNNGSIVVTSCDGTLCSDNLQQVYRLYQQGSQRGTLPLEKESDLLYSLRELRFGQHGWMLAALIPEDVLFAPARATARHSMLVSFVILLVFIALVYVLARRMGRPIAELAWQAKELKALNTSFTIPTNSDITEIHMAQDALNSLKNGMSAFSRYIPKTLVRQLIESGVETRIGGEEKMLVVMFTDIENFTSISEQLSPAELTEQLSEYFELMSTTIMNNAGTIDKYIGDAVLAFWGAPLEVEHPVHRAVTSAQMLMRKLKAYNAEREALGLPPFHTRIGIHYGKTLVGNIGSSERINYTILGDAVNLAARLESINKEYGTQVLVSEAVQQQLGNDIATRYIDEVQLRGRSETTRIYTLDEPEENTDS